MYNIFEVCHGLWVTERRHCVLLIGLNKKRMIIIRTVSD